MANMFDQFDEEQPLEQPTMPREVPGAPAPAAPVTAENPFRRPGTQASQPATHVEGQQGTMFDLGDTLGAVPGGMVASIESQGDLLTEIIHRVGGGRIPLGFALGRETVANMGGDGVFELVYDPKYIDDPIFGKVGESDALGTETHSTSAGMVKGVSQFVTGFLTAGKILGPLRASAATTTGGMAIRGLGQGAVADAISFDSHEARLSNFVQSFPTLENPVTAWLSADEDDGFFEGRMKNAVEGMFLGVAAEGVFRALRGMKEARKLAKEGKYAEANAVLQKHADEAQKELKLVDEELPGSVDKPADVAKQINESAATRERDWLHLKDKHPQGAKYDHTNPRVIDELKKRAAVTADDFATDADGEYLLSDWLNWDKLDTTRDTDAMIQEAQSHADDLLETISKGGTQSEAEVIKNAATWLSETMGHGYDEVMAVLMKDAEGTKQIARNAVAHKMLLQSLTDDIGRLAANTAQLGSTEFKFRLARRFEQMEDVLAVMKGAQRNVARGQAIMRNQVGGTLDTTKLAIADIMDQIKAAGGDEVLMKRAQRIAAAVNSKGRLAAAKYKGRFSRAIGVHNEFYINSILSGYKTQLINLFSNTLQTFVMPLDRIVGGAVSLNGREMEAGLYQLYKVFGAAHDSLKLAAVTLRTGRNVLDSNLTKFDFPEHAIYSDRDDLAGSLIRGIGTAVRAPMRLLMTTDEFFSQVNFRSDLQARLYTEGKKRFGQDAGKRAKWMADEWEKAFTRDKHEATWGDVFGDGQALRNIGGANNRAAQGVAQNHAMPSQFAEDSVNYARETIFTTDLKSHKTWGDVQSLGATIQNAAIQFPIMRPLVPFIRTPTNLLRTWAQHGPMAPLYRQWWDDVAKGGEFRARALGKVSVGMAMYYGAYELAASGKITGAGPENPDELKLLREGKWQPYSFVIDNEDGTKQYVSFNRADPMGMLFGMTADLMYASNHLNAAEIDTWASVIMSSVLRNVSNKAYFKGITDALTALKGGQDSGRLTYWARNYVSGYVPNVVTDTAKGMQWGFDEYDRAGINVLDGLRRKVPGWNLDLPPRRSWITGEPQKWVDEANYPDAISPFPLSSQPDDPVYKVLAQVEHGFTAPEKFVANVNLEADMPEAYNDLLKFTARPVKGAPSLYEALKDLIEAMPPERWEQERVLLNDGAPGSLIAQTINRYKAMGRQKLLYDSKWSDTLLPLEQQRQTDRALTNAGDKEALQRLDANRLNR